MEKSKILLKLSLNQLVRKNRIEKKMKTKVPALISCPQKLGSVIRVLEQSPKKPNSAKRKVAKVRLKHTGRTITAHIPGEGHNLTKHSTVLIRGGRCQDLIGVRYKPIRGKESFSALEKRVTRLSKYGVKKKPRFIDSREFFNESLKNTKIEFKNHVDSRYNRLYSDYIHFYFNLMERLKFKNDIFFKSYFFKKKKKRRKLTIMKFNLLKFNSYINLFIF